jgi:copper chaperone CopZ
MICTLFALSFCVGLSACYRQDIQTLNVSVPGMKSQECAGIIYNGFQTQPPLEGIVSVKTDVANRTVSVTYDSRKIAIKNIEYLICDLGFEANGNPPRPGTQEKLPEGCR